MKMYKERIAPQQTSAIQNATTEKKLVFNILPVKLPQTKVTVCFTKNELNSGLRIPLYYLPTGFHNHFTENGIKAPHVYTLFENVSDGVNLEIDLKEHPSVYRAYLTHIIRNHLTAFADVTVTNFLKDTQFWFLDKTREDTKFVVYKKFTLRIQIDEKSNLPELLISFDGSSRVLKTSCQVLMRNNPMNDWNRVVYKNRVFQYGNLPNMARYNLAEVFPIVNQTIAAKYGISWQYTPDKQLHHKYQQQIEEFFRKYIDTAEFKNLLSHHGQFKPIPSGDQFKLALKNNMLLFGQDKSGQDIIKGLKDWGPAMLPPANRYEYFYIYPENHRDSIKKLHDFVRYDGQSHNGMNQFILNPYRMNKAMNIAFDPNKEPLPYIKDQIRQLILDPKTGYFAIFVSPWSEWEQDQKKWIVYHRLKEALLNRNIMLQVFNRNKLVTGNLQYFMPNVAVALTAKLGGVPWRLNKPVKDELVIGFGAFRSNRLNIKYVGASFCFSGDGAFRKFDCFRADSTYAIAGSVVEAINKYREEKKDIRRIVIHFYKKLSRKEMQPIEKALNEMAVDIPILIVSINKSGSRDIMAMFQGNACGMPTSGSYYRFAKDRYLLYINDRMTTDDQNPTTMPLPIKIGLASSTEKLHADPGVVAELMQQVYDFCFMYWRSVKHSRLPVTVVYPELLAKIIPWFENEVFTENGQDRLWFL